MSHIAFEALNLIALLLIGAGFLWKDRRCHILRAAGWVLLGLYWLSRASGYLLEDDVINGLASILAMPIFGFLGFHEVRSYQWDDEYAPLRFVAGAMFIAGLGYFIIGNVPWTSTLLITVVAHQSVGLANLFGYDFGVGAITPESAQLVGVPIEIIIECTAIQAFFVAGAFLCGCRGDRERRVQTFLIMAPIIYMVNLARNALVIILTFENGEEYFEFAHNYIGKGLSLAVLVILILFAFIRVPELYEDINGLFELPWRKGPGHDYLRFVGRLYDKDEEEIK